MTAPAGSAAAFRNARRGKLIISSSRQASLANMRALVAAGEAETHGEGGEAGGSVGTVSMTRELRKCGMEPAK